MIVHHPYAPQYLNSHSPSRFQHSFMYSSNKTQTITTIGKYGRVCCKLLIFKLLILTIKIKNVIIFHLEAGSFRYKITVVLVKCWSLTTSIQTEKKLTITNFKI